MREFRPAKGVTEHYTSLEALRAAWNCKPISKRTSDAEKLNKQRETFCSKHICKACGKPMTFVCGTNIMCCTNEKCNGIKHQTINEETGETKIWYTTSFKSLDEKGADIANNIFA